jgi:hypothetical protein
MPFEPTPKSARSASLLSRKHNNDPEQFGDDTSRNGRWEEDDGRGPTASRARKRLPRRGNPVIDGPFTETKEMIVSQRSRE